MAENLAILHFLGPVEIGVIFFLFLLLFGAKRLPAMAKGIKEAVLELRKGVRDDDE